MIITIRQLKLIHYYYFAMGIFGLTNAILIGFGSIFSIIFIIFYVLNSGVSWYVALVARKKMTDYVIVQSLGFFVRHVAVSVLTVGATTLFWISGLVPDAGLLNTMLMANYFVLFVAGLWYMPPRTDFVGELFTIYDNYLFKKSKSFMLGVRRAHREFFGRELVTETQIRDYEYGTINDVDDNLISAWKNKSKMQYVLECLGRIEISLSRFALKIMREKLFFLGGLSDTYENQKLRDDAKRELAEREKDVNEFEKSFYRKTGESEFISS